MTLLGAMSSGGGGVDLTGLTPEQISTIAGTGLKTADLNRATMANIHDMFYKGGVADRAERTHDLNTAKFLMDSQKFDYQQKASEARQMGNEAYARTLDAKADIIERIKKRDPTVTDSEKKFAGAFVAPPTTRAPTIAERNIDSTLSNSLFKVIQDDDGNIIDNPSTEAIENLSRTARQYGREVLEIPIGAAEDPKIFGRAKPPRKIYMVVRQGENPSRERILNHLSSVYGYEPEELESLRGK